MPPHLDCRALDALVIAWEERSLPGEPRRTFAAHLLLCRACRRDLAGYLRTVELVRGLAPGEPDPVPEALVQRVLAQRPQTSPSGPPPAPRSSSA